MTTKQYNTEDFANAEFARHPNGRIATRIDSDDLPWRTVGAWLGDADMARNGWVPVREAQPITLDSLHEAWENAEAVPVPADLIREAEKWADETRARVTLEEDILHRIVQAVREREGES